MKNICLLLVALLVSSVAMSAAAVDIPPQLLSFSVAKERQARELATNSNLTVSPQIWDFFKAAEQGDWLSVSNGFARLRQRNNQYEGNTTNDPTVASPVWQTLIEVQLAFWPFTAGGPKYPLAYGEGIIKSIPSGSIYFGGTDPGRGLVTALCRSQIQADPFYTLTQNALADSRYLDYLRSMYGKRIYLPTAEDSQKAFADYTQDVTRRKELNQLKPGEEVTVEQGRVQVRGQVAVMSINGLLVKDIFEHNPNCEFYLEESFPLDWMYPYLVPHGLIFKLNHEPLPALPAEQVAADHAFWSKQCGAMLGDWLKPETTVSNVCAFVSVVYLKKDYSHFTGDQEFVTNDFATRSYSKLRSSLAGLYAWRLTMNKAEAGDKAQLRAETDYAFKQAFALCPFSPEAVYRYVNFLLAQNRTEDAVLIAATASKLNPENEQLKNLLAQLQNYGEQKNKTPAH
jgi:hypothetical protein